MTLWNRIAAVLAISLAVGYEYSTIRTAGFVYEDYLWNQACQSESVSNRLTSLRSIPRSGAILSWCWQRHQGDTPFDFHVVNLALHLAVSFLLGVLVFQLTANEPIAWAIGGLFALHPLGIESAGYLAGRGELIAALGVVLACIAAMEREFVSMLFAIFLGMLGKETAIVALILVPLVLTMRSKWFATVTAVASSVVLGTIVAATLAVHLIHLPLVTRIEWALMQSTAFTRLTTLALIPWGQTPTHDYAGIGLFWQALTLTGMGGLLWITYRLREQGLVALGLAWLVLTAAPRLVVPTPPSPLNEHQFYVPLMGVLLMAAAGLQRLSVRTA